MSEKKAVHVDNALQVWAIQNDLLLEYGVDVVERSFALKGHIDEHSFQELNIKLSLLERNTEKPEPITIKLNNGGGSVYDAWAMVSRIKASPCDIIIEAHGHIMSAATMLFAAADKRKVSKYCVFMFHETSFGIEGKVRDVINYTKHLEAEENMYCKFLSENSKKSSLFWKKMLHSKKDVYLTANDILKIGLATEVF